jgi:hypothetical protein
MATSLPIPCDSQAKLLHIFHLSAELIAARIFASVSMRDISLATPFGEYIPGRTR